MKRRGKKLVSGAIAATMMLSSMQGLPVNVFAANEEAGSTQNEEASVSLETFLEAFNELRSMLKVWVDDADGDALAEKIDEVQRLYESVDDGVKAEWAEQNPTDIVAYTMLDYNFSALQTASEVAKLIDAIGSYDDESNYEDYKDRIEAARAAADALTNTKAYKYLGFDESFEVIGTNYADELKSAESWYATQQNATAGAVIEKLQKLDNYNESNFIEKGFDYADAVAAYTDVEERANDEGEDSEAAAVLAIIKNSSAYEAYENAVANEPTYNQNLGNTLNSLFDSIDGDNRNLNKINERESNINSLNNYYDRIFGNTENEIPVSYYANTYDKQDLTRYIVALAEDKNAKEYVDNANEIISTYSNVTVENAQIEQICSGLPATIENIALYNGVSDYWMENDPVASDYVTVEAIYDVLLAAAGNYVDIVKNDVRDVADYSGDKFTKDYIDKVVDAREEVDSILKVLSDALSGDYTTDYEDADAAISTAEGELNSIVQTNTDDVLTNAEAISSAIGSLGYTYAYGYNEDGSTSDAEDASAVLDDNRAVYDGFAAVVEIVDYYNEKYNNDAADWQDVDTAKNDLDALEEHIDAVNTLKSAAEAVKNAYEQCPITKDLFADDDNYEAFIEFVKSLNPGLELDVEDGAIDKFIVAYNNLQTEMASYKVAISNYAYDAEAIEAGLYTDSLFDEDGDIYGDGAYVERALYNDWSDIQEAVSDALSDIEIGSEEADAFLEDFNNYYDAFTACDNTQYDSGFEEVKGYIEQLGEHNDNNEETMWGKFDAVMSSVAGFTYGPSEIDDIAAKFAELADLKSDWEGVIDFSDTVDELYEGINDIDISIDTDDGVAEPIIPDDDYIATAERASSAYDVMSDNQQALVNQSVKDNLELIIGKLESLSVSVEWINSVYSLYNDITSVNAAAAVRGFVTEMDRLEAEYQSMNDYEHDWCDSVYDSIFSIIKSKLENAKRAIELDDKIKVMDGLSGDEKRAAFNELYNEVPYTSNSGETIYGLKDLTDIVENNPDMLRYMTQTARYQVCMNQIYNADIDDYVSAVKAIPEITYANYNTEEISDAIDKAQAAYDKMGVDGLFAGKQLSESRVAYYKNIFDDIVNARNVLINAEEASAEYILRIKEIVNTVNGMIEDVEAYESDYDNVKADIAELAADLDALAGENYSAYAYIKNNVQENYIESFENASNAFVSAFKFIGVKREIAEVYDAYQRNESGLTIRINDCEESYNNLSDDQKKLVTNYSYLVYMKTNNEDDIVAGVVNKIGSLAENYTLSEMSIGDFAKDENGEYVLAELLSTIEEIRAELNLLSNDKAAECEDKISQAGYDGLIDAWAIIADAVKAKEDGTLKLGDVNGDGSVNITDIVKMVDRLNEKPLVSGDSESLEYYAANIAAEFKMDVNGNGSIDLNDIVVTIRNLIEF